MSQLLPTLLPPTSSSKAHPPHPAHLHRTHSPTLLLGCYSLLPALGGSPCSGSEPLPHGKGLVGRCRYRCHPPTALRSSTFRRGSRQEQGTLAGSGAAWLPACWRGCWQLRWISSPLGPVHPLAECRRKESKRSSPQGQANPTPGQLNQSTRETAPAANPTPNPAQSKGDRLRGRPSPWHFAASWFPELA